MTEKLYYTDSHIHEFKALVKSCATCREGWAVTLDKTAFFPEGGGQAADTGRIGGAGCWTFRNGTERFCTIPTGLLRREPGACLCP